MSRGTSTRKPRASSQARIATILAAARELLAAEGVGALSIYGVAERAQIPPSSVYHFFANVPALLEALTADVHRAFREALQAPVTDQALDSWRTLSRLIEQRMIALYNEDAAARQLILAQHGLSEVAQADRHHDLQLGKRMQALFDQYFHLPVMPTDIDVFALAMAITDRVYAHSIQQHGTITERFAEEAMRVCEAYLGAYLPPFLARRSAPVHITM